MTFSKMTVLYLFNIICTIIISSVNSLTNQTFKTNTAGIKTAILMDLTSTFDSAVVPVPATRKKPVSKGSWGKVRFASVHVLPYSVNDCSNNWSVAIGRDAVIARIIAHHIGNWSCLSSDDLSLEGINGNYDVLANPMQLTNREDEIYPHAREDLCFLMHRKLRRYNTILQTFMFFTWMANIITVLIFTFLFKMFDKERSFTEVIRTLICGAFFEKKDNSFANYLSLILSAFGFLMTSAFSGRFMSFLIRDQEVEQTHTLLKAVSEAEYFIYSHSFQVLKPSMFEDELFLAMSEKRNRTAYASDGMDTILSEIINNNAVYVSNLGAFQFIQLFPRSVDSRGHPLTHVVEECLLSPAYAAFHVRPDRKYKEEISIMVQKLVEAGISEMAHRHSMYPWRKLFKDFFKVDLLQVSNPPVSDEPSVLGLRSFTEPGIILAIGFLVSTLSFIAEHVFHQTRHRKKTNRIG